ACSLYIGGGSPSFLPLSLILKLLKECFTLLNFTPNPELSIEANPHHVSPAWAQALLTAGINRVSLGLQSLNDYHLASLGRIHDAASARHACSILRAAGLTNLSLDLIFGIPNQSMDSWRVTLEDVVTNLHPEHLSLYALDLSRSSTLARIRTSSPTRYKWPDDELVMDMYWFAIDFLAQYGYQHYEISNLARPGYACQHNLAYWDTQKHYLGLGAAAHSYCALLPHQQPRRFHNIYHPRTYCERVLAGHGWRKYARPLSHRQQLGEEIYLGLRRISGIHLRPDHLRHYSDTIATLISQKLLQTLPSGAIALTHRGIELANTVMANFV
ncbi:MAG: coproporphyrinogen III oxidase family protein, partial [bacterium]|nr:coproporphyrinogen III oxidase family protein [bacterium]